MYYDTREKHLLNVIGNRPSSERNSVGLDRRSSPDIHEDPISSADDEFGDDAEAPRPLDSTLRSSHEPGLAHLPPPSSSLAPSSSDHTSLPDHSARRTRTSSASKCRAQLSGSASEDHLRDEYGFINSSQGRKRQRKQKGYARSGQVRLPDQARKTSTTKIGPPKQEHQLAMKDFEDPLQKHDVESKLRRLEQSSALKRFEIPSEKYRLPSPAEQDPAPKFKMPPNTRSTARDPSDAGALESRALRSKRGLAKGRLEHGKGKRDVGAIVDSVLNFQTRNISHILGDDDLSPALTPPSVAIEGAISHSSETSSLSSPPASPKPDSPEPSFLDNSPKKGHACPMCRETVDSALWLELDGARRMNVRKQVIFCRAHKVKSAQAEWDRRKYPEINWERLPTRIAKYYSRLDDVLQGKEHSTYRAALDATIKSGRNRTLQQSMTTGDIHGLTPGYYGSRGARIMLESVMSRFSRQIRRLAATDKIIASRGVSGYVQAVLVRELAVMLIQEDMRCDAPRAREILGDSVSIGDLLNEEQDDDIRPLPNEADGDSEASMDEDDDVLLDR